MDGNRPDIRDLACQLSASFLSRFVVSRRSVPSLVIILELYSDAACPDIELESNIGISGKNFLPVGKFFLPEIPKLEFSSISRRQASL